MSEYVLITDSSADLSQEMVQELGVTVLPLSFTIQVRRPEPGDGPGAGSDGSAPELYHSGKDLPKLSG